MLSSPRQGPMNSKNTVHIWVEIPSNLYSWLYNTAQESKTTVDNLIKAGICALQAYRETCSHDNKDSLVVNPDVDPVTLCESSDPSQISIMLGTTLKDAERHILLETLSYCKFSQINTARMLAVSSRTVRNKLSAYSEENDAR